MNIDLSYYALVFLRRLHIFLIVALGVAAAGVYIAMTLPPMYNAQARLLVESPQIPDELAASTVRTGASEQLAVTEQLLMTRNNLIDIANSLKVFGATGRLSADAIVERMRAQTTIRRRGNDASILEIGFRSSDPQIAARVTNEYVTRVLQQNVENRTGRAEDTLEFFENEVERLGVDLDRQSARIVAFKNERRGALPNSLDFRMSRQSFQQERVDQIDRDLAALADQRERLTAGVREWRQPGNRPHRIVSRRAAARRPAPAARQCACSLFSDESPGPDPAGAGPAHGAADRFSGWRVRPAGGPPPSRSSTCRWPRSTHAAPIWRSSAARPSRSLPG